VRLKPSCLAIVRTLGAGTSRDIDVSDTSLLAGRSQGEHISAIAYAFECNVIPHVSTLSLLVPTADLIFVLLIYDSPRSFSSDC